MQLVIYAVAAMKPPADMGARVGGGASGATSRLTTLSKEATNESIFETVSFSCRCCSLLGYFCLCDPAGSNSEPQRIPERGARQSEHSRKEGRVRLRTALRRPGKPAYGNVVFACWTGSVSLDPCFHSNNCFMIGMKYQVMSLFHNSMRKVEKLRMYSRPNDLEKGRFPFRPCWRACPGSFSRCFSSSPWRWLRPRRAGGDEICVLITRKTGSTRSLLSMDDSLVQTLFQQ